MTGLETEPSDTGDPQAVQLSPAAQRPESKTTEFTGCFGRWQPTDGAVTF